MTISLTVTGARSQGSGTGSYTLSVSGLRGQGAFTTTTAAYTQPAVSATVTVSVQSSAWLAVGSLVRTPGGDYEVTALPTSTSVTLQNLGYPGAASPGAMVASGSSVTATGARGADGADGAAGAAGAAGTNGTNGADGINGSIVVDLVAESNLTLSGEQTIDGVTTSASRVLVTAQSTAANNGIYVTAAGSWTRATDYDAATEVLRGRVIYVASGQLRAESLWTLTTAGTITVGSTSLAFSRLTKTTKRTYSVAISGSVGTTDTTLVTLPTSGFWVASVYEKLTTAPTGAGSAVVSVGVSAGGAELLAATSAITSSTTANTVWGLALTELGTDLTLANGYQKIYTAGQSIRMRVVISGASLSGGVIEITVIGYDLP